MKRISRFLLIVVSVLTVAAWHAPTAQAQYKTYPSYYGLTPSPAYYDLKNEYDRDTYMNPNPFPSYDPAPYVPAPSPYGYYNAYPRAGYIYGGPAVYGHYGRMGRMSFHYGWW
jgi:hypothetical protein